MSKFAAQKTTSGAARSTIVARLACVGLLQAALLGCGERSDPATQVTVEQLTSPCAGSLTGTQRTIELSLNSAPIWEQLKAKEIVLTFDDGPEPGRTDKVLDVLDEYCVQAAFFLRGDQAERHPEMVRAIVRRGHVVGGHGWAHASLVEMPVEDARAEIARSVAVIDDALAASPETANEKTRLFRFPYVQSNSEVEAIVADMNLVPVPVQADGKDWELSNPGEIVANVFKMLRKAENRGVVLLHDPFSTSDRATDMLLRRLQDEGYRIVSIRAEGG